MMGPGWLVYSRSRCSRDAFKSFLAIGSRKFPVLRNRAGVMTLSEIGLSGGPRAASSGHMRISCRSGVLQYVSFSEAEAGILSKACVVACDSRGSSGIRT